MAEFTTPTKVEVKNKIIPLNRWFYFGIAASLTLAFILFYKLNENVTNSSLHKVAQKIESTSSTKVVIPEKTTTDNSVSEVYTTVLADTITKQSSPSVAESNNLPSKKNELQSRTEIPFENINDTQKDLEPATRADHVSLSEDAKYSIGKNGEQPAFVEKKQQNIGISLAEVSQLQNSTVEIY